MTDTEKKGPYMMNDKIDVGRGRLWFISSVSELDIANTAYAAGFADGKTVGRSSRDGLRKAVADYKAEVQNPGVDSVMRRVMRDRLFSALEKDDTNG